MRHLVFTALAIAMAATASAETAKPQVDTRVVMANTGFGFSLFQQLVKDTGGKENVIISPASLSLALSMTYNGASGTTKDAMAKVLGYPGMTLDQVNSGNRTLVSALQKPAEGVELSIANSLWGRKDVRFEPDFLQRNKDFFQAKITTLDFADPKAPDTINAWVKEKTRGKIESIVGALYPTDILYLLNAVYFKGTWTAPFDEKLTREGEFKTAWGQTRTVQMMHQTGHWDYMERPSLQAISLTYGKGRFSMYVVLPAKGRDPMSIWAGATPEDVAQSMNEMHGHRKKVELTLPRFKSELKLDREMKTALSALGMGVAFDPDAADFDAMVSSPKVHIGQVVHKTFVEVNEKGTEAAAATSVGMVATAAPVPETAAVMTADHPFFIAIWDNDTNAMLFLGLITDPNPPVMLEKPAK